MILPTAFEDFLIDFLLFIIGGLMISLKSNPQRYYWKKVENALWGWRTFSLFTSLPAPSVFIQAEISNFFDFCTLNFLPRFNSSHFQCWNWNSLDPDSTTCRKIFLKLLFVIERIHVKTCRVCKMHRNVQVRQQSPSSARPKSSITSTFSSFIQDPTNLFQSLEVQLRDVFLFLASWNAKNNNFFNGTELRADRSCFSIYTR